MTKTDASLLYNFHFIFHSSFVLDLSTNQPNKMMRLMEEYWNIINGSYYALFGLHSSLVKKKIMQPFFSDLSDNVKQLLIDNHFYWQQLSWILIGIWLISNIRYRLCNHLIKFLIENDFLHKQDSPRFISNIWDTIFYVNTVLLSRKIATSLQLFDHNDGGDHYFDTAKLLPTTTNNPTNTDPSNYLLIRLLLVMDISNYIHSTYYLIFLDVWNRDSWVMIAHHIIATSILAISYIVHMERMVVVGIYLLEICEVFYFVRCLSKIKLFLIQNYINQWRALVFTILIFVWFYNRLYLFPFIILRTSLDFGLHQLIHMKHVALYIILYYFLIVIQIFNIYWAFQLIRATIRIFRKGLKNIEDFREFNIDEMDGCNDEHNEKKLA